MDIHVSNIPENIALEKIKALFSDFGSVLKISYSSGPDGLTDKSTCIVSMRDDDRAKVAIEKLDGYSIRDQNIQVNAITKKLNHRRRRVPNRTPGFQSQPPM